MKLNLNNTLFEEFEDPTLQGGAGGGYEAPDYEEQGDPNADEEFENLEEGSEEEQEEKAPKNWDPMALSQAIVAGLTPVLTPRQAPAPQKELTDEEFKAKTGYFVVSDDMVQALFGDEDPGTIAKKKAFLQSMVDGAATHALKVSGLATRGLVDQVRGEYEPIKKAHAEQAFESFVSTVEKSHAGLKGMRPAIKMAIQHLQQSGFQSDGNPVNDRKAITTVVEQLARQYNPTFSLAKAPNSSTGSRSSMPRMGSGVNRTGGPSGGPTRKAPVPAWQGLYAPTKK